MLFRRVWVMHINIPSHASFTLTSPQGHAFFTRTE